MWQDIVLTSGGFLLALALLPSVVSEHKPALWTSILTGSVLAGFTITYFTLNLPLAGSTTGATALMWALLAIQKYNQGGIA